MKRLTSIIILLAAIVSCNSPKHNFSFDVQIKEGYDYNGRWAYLTALYDNEYIWLDSVLIENNVAKLRGEILYDEYLCELLIEDEPRTFNQLIFAPGEVATFTFDPELRTQFPYVAGSNATTQVAQFHEANNAITSNLINLNSARVEVQEGSADQRTIDSMILVEQNMRIRNIEMAFESAISFVSAYHPYVFIESMSSPADAQRAKDRMLSRWSNSVNLSMITGISTISGDSIKNSRPEHIEIYNRRAEIIGDVSPYIVVEQLATLRDEPYKVGDVIDELTLPLVKGGEIVIPNQDKAFTLVDFWASWCIPCRNEIPKIVELSTEFSDVLNVVMISIDTNINNCKQAIEEDGSQMLNHTTLRSNNPIHKSTVELFNIRAIPRNVLLDSDGRIVAENLNSEKLREKLKELMQGSY